MTSTALDAARRPLPRHAGLRLTPRGRLLVLVALVALAFLLVSLGRVTGTASTGPDLPTAPVTTTWVVQPGETLWGIAADVVPGADPRETIARIIELNRLDSSGVRAGQVLEVPA